MKPARLVWPVLLLAGLSLSAWQWHEPDDDARAQHGHAHLHDDSGKPARLYAWQADDAARLTLSSAAATLTYTRGASGWEAPAAAQPFDPAGFLALFSQARSDRTLIPHPDESYGLSPPGLRIAVHDAAGAALARMDVGALAPDGLGRYVRLPGEAQIRIIPDYQTRAPLAAMARGP